jgi:hypothetical protein
MDLEDKLSQVLEVFDRQGIAVRFESLGGEGGGLCKLKTQLMVFIDVDAEPEARYNTALAALIGRPGLDNLYLPPEIREDLERCQAQIESNA